MDNFVTKNEVVESIKSEINKKIISPLYGTFIIYWSLFHWKFLVTLFFVSGEQIQKSTGLLKADYLESYISNWHSWYFYFSWILPVIFTYLTIWHFPKWFLLRAYQKDIDYHVEKEKIRLKGEEDISKKETVLQKEQTKQVEEKIQTAKKEKELSIIDPKILWKEEYEKFIKLALFPKFEQILKSIYENSGRLTEYNHNGYEIKIIEKDILAYTHTNGIINLVEDRAKNTTSIELTEKGKFFVKQYTSK